MTVEETNLLIDKALNKKDGVYSYKGYLWVVKDFEFIAFANSFGDCYVRSGFFNVKIGVVNRYERKKKLTELLKNQSKQQTNK